MMLDRKKTPNSSEAERALSSLAFLQRRPRSTFEDLIADLYLPSQPKKVAREGAIYAIHAEHVASYERCLRNAAMKPHILLNLPVWLRVACVYAAADSSQYDSVFPSSDLDQETLLSICPDYTRYAAYQQYGNCFYT